MKALCYPISILLLFIAPLMSYAQKPPIKLGEISKEELQMEQYDLEPDAEAVVLCDYGFRNYTFDLNDFQWKHDLKRICRIKIFNDEGYSWATESILLYDNGNIKEDLGQLKGYTYNLEDGKIEKTKLDKDNIFSEKASDNYTRIKFTLPNVKAGSIIEFQYNVSSNAISMIDPWYFQRSIPVEWSEYVLQTPEYLQYVTNATGFEKYHVYEKERRAASVNWISNSRNSFTGQSTGMSTGKKSYSNDWFRYVAKDMPALKDEVFVGNSHNYLQSVGFQLSTYRSITDNSIQNALGNWPDIIKQLNVEDENFGPNMRARNFYKEITEPIIEKYATPEERIAAVYAFVSNYMKWDDRYRFVPSQNIRKAFDERTGSSADINALLVSMLRAVEVDADPVILSTVNNGLVHPIYPVMDKYNYMIARATVGNGYILLDATEKDMPLGLLPTRCLNQRGYAISSSKPGWVDLVPQDGYNRTVMSTLSIGEDGKMSGSIQYKLEGYSGLNSRKKLRNDGKDKFIEDFTSSHTDWTIKSMEIEDEESIGEPLKEKVEVDITGKGEAMGSMIYIDPILSGKMDENPFKQETRKLPIEFVIPIKNTYMLMLEIPEGYTVDELPESANIMTSDKTAYLKYMSQVMGNRIQIVNSWGIKQTFYSPESFKELKEFYALLVAKHSEQIVLKKISAN